MTSHPLRRGAATFWRRQEKDLTEGLSRRGERREERAAGRSRSHHPPPLPGRGGHLQKWGAEARGKHALGGRERQGMTRRGSLSTVLGDGGFHKEATHPIRIWKRRWRGCPLPRIVSTCDHAGGTPLQKPPTIVLQEPRCGGRTPVWAPRLTIPTVHRLPQGGEEKLQNKPNTHLEILLIEIGKWNWWWLWWSWGGNWPVEDASGIIQRLRKTPVIKQPKCKGPGHGGASCSIVPYAINAVVYMLGKAHTRPRVSALPTGTRGHPPAFLPAPLPFHLSYGLAFLKWI